MAILTKNNFLAQERFDLEDVNFLLSSIGTDWNFFINGVFSISYQILSGFNITSTAGSALSGSAVQVALANSVLLNSNNTNGYSFFVAPSTAIPLTAVVTLGTRNYVELTLSEVTATPLPRNFWDPTANNGAGSEFIQTVDTVQNLEANLTLSTTGFSASPNIIPLGIIDVDAFGNVKTVLDARPLFFRLGAFTNEQNSYSWSQRTEPTLAVVLTSVTGTFQAGETVNFGVGNATATVSSYNSGTTTLYINNISSANLAALDIVTGNTSGATGTVSTIQDSFAGADKDISNLKEMFEALQTEIKLLKGTSYWFNNPSATIPGLLQLVNGTLYPNGADTNTPLFSWDGSNLYITDKATTTINLTSVTGTFQVGETVAIKNGVNLVTNAIVQTGGTSPIVVFQLTAAIANGYTVTGDTSLATGTISSFSSSIADTDIIANLALFGSGNTLNLLRQDGQASTTPIAVANNTVLYLSIPNPSSPSTINYSNTLSGAGYSPYNTIAINSYVPSENNYWIAFRGNGNDIIVRGTGSLDPGASELISNPIPATLLNSIGLATETSSPNYSSNIRGSQAESLVSRASVLTDAVGDEQEDRSAYIRSDQQVTWSGTSLTINADIVLEIINTKGGTPTEHLIHYATYPQVFSLNSGDALYVTINRTPAGNTENLTFSTLLSGSNLPAQVEAEKDIFVLFKRLDTTGGAQQLYLPFSKQLISSGSTVYLGASGGGSGGGSGTGAINYILNPGFESGLSGWNLYKEVVQGFTPLTGTGGTSNLTFTANTISPLRGLQSGEINNGTSTNNAGQGLSYDFTIDPTDEGRVLGISFDYKPGTGFISSNLPTPINDAGNNAGQVVYGASWPNSQNGMYLFGGTSIGGARNNSSLWLLNHQNPLWINGSNSVITGSYSTSPYFPGSRLGSATWVDSSGNLWMYGGFGVTNTVATSAYLSDLWKYVPSTNTWTLMAGGTATNTLATYPGTIGSAGTPGSRQDAYTWIDSSNNLWMYGGVGYNASSAGDLADLWYYNTTTNAWIWAGGSQSLGVAPVYPGSAPGTGTMGSRYGGCAWVDSSGNFWLFGGQTSGGDAWWFTPNGLGVTTFTYAGGTQTQGATGTYPAPGNTGIPGGGRHYAAYWTDTSGNFWFFGGSGTGASGSGYLDDVWKFTPTIIAAVSFTFVSGTGTINIAPTYPSLINQSGDPGSRDEMCFYSKEGNLYIYSGIIGSSSAYAQDLWYYNTSDTTWYWIGGSQTTSSNLLNYPSQQNTLGIQYFSDIQVFVYDKTNAEIIPVTPAVLTGYENSISTFTGSFQTNINSTSYRLILAGSSLNSGYTFEVDNFLVGPQAVSQASAISDYQQYILNITAPTTNPTKGTIIVDNAQWRRVGDSLELIYEFAQSTAGTAGSGTYLFSLPPGLSIDTTKLPISTSQYFTTVGNGYIGTTTAQSTTFVQAVEVVAYDSSHLALYYRVQNAAEVLAVNQADFGLNVANQYYSFEAKMPIAGWETNIPIANSYSGRLISALVQDTAGGSVANVTSTKIVFTSVVNDSTSSYSTSTGVYTVPVSGIYNITAEVVFTTSSANACTLMVYKNGVQAYELARGSLVADGLSGALNSIPLNAGDQISIYVNQSSGGSLTLSTGGNLFSIQKAESSSAVAATETIACSYYANPTATGIPNNSTTNLSSTYVTYTKVVDTHAAFNTTNGAYTVPMTGIYEVSGSVIYTANATGIRDFIISQTGSSSISLLSSSAGSSNGATGPTGSFQFNCVAGDILQIQAYQSSGGTLTIGNTVNFNFRKIG